MVETVPAGITVTDIAESLGVARHRVVHILKTRPEIRPVGRLGNNRVYLPAAADQVRAELDRIVRRRAS